MLNASSARPEQPVRRQYAVRNPSHRAEGRPTAAARFVRQRAQAEILSCRAGTAPLRPDGGATSLHLHERDGPSHEAQRDRLHAAGADAPLPSA